MELEELITSNTNTFNTVNIVINEEIKAVLRDYNDAEMVINYGFKPIIKK